MKNYEEKSTKDPRLFRLVNSEGDWKQYVLYSKPDQKGTKIYLDAVNYILSEGYEKGYFFRKYLASHTEEEIEKRLTEAGDHGDMTHRLIEVLIREGKIDRTTLIYDDRQKLELPPKTDDIEAVATFAKFITDHEAKILGNELPLYNTVKKYAGTTDLILILTKACGGRYCTCKNFVGKVGLYDLKTGSEWADHAVQLGAYSGCPNLKNYLHGLKLEYTALLYLGRDTNSGYKLIPFDADETTHNQKVFLSAKVIKDSKIKPFDPSVIHELPDEVTLTNHLYEPTK